MAAPTTDDDSGWWPEVAAGYGGLPTMAAPTTAAGGDRGPTGSQGHDGCAVSPMAAVVTRRRERTGTRRCTWHTISSNARGSQMGDVERCVPRRLRVWGATLVRHTHWSRGDVGAHTCE